MAWRDPFQEKKEVYKPNPKSLDGVPDLCMLTYLGEENVLYNLNFRYKQSNCYTSTTSKVLVAVNPYERMDHNYSNDVMDKYQRAEINLEGVQGEKDLPPHVFTVANSAYQNLLAKKQNQSIIVCGESGSGKTESAKYQMRFLAFTTTSGAKDKAEFDAADKVGQQVLDANPILESFGNAKTLLNNNSSRFGKFTKMLFDEVKGETGTKQRRRLVGAAIETYLLEKSRVVKQDKGERTFHIFYQLTFHHKGHADLPELKLGGVETYHYTNQSGVHTLDDLRFPGKAADGEWFKELITAFKTLQVPRTETDDIFRIVSGILHLGNINFEQLKGEGSEIKEKDEMGVAADMFQVNVSGLEKRLKTRSILLPGDKLIVKPLNEPDAVFNRDSCSRNLYNGLFRWIVSRINKTSSSQEAPTMNWIGILDVFGFEIFQHNSFEQFCINFANERLQQYFNEHVLKAEQDLYKREALLWDPIDLPDNQDCIDLVMSKPYGILPILDSTCVQPKGTDVVFTTNLFKAHKYHPRLREMKQHKKSDSDKQFTAMNGFVIRHYAGAVLYDCAEFLIKNADASEFDTVELFMESKSQLATEILRIQANGTLEDGKRSAKRAFRSTGTVFSEQLDSLMRTLKQTAPYFVRCIKPNSQKKPKDFEGEYVRPQLRCGGLIEALRIIKLGFPTRCAYKRVHEIFAPILKDQKPMPNLNIRDFTEAIMKYCGDTTKKIASSDYQLGLTMVFFRPGCQTYLTDILEKKPEGVTAQQKIQIRKFLVKKRWIRGRGTVRAINTSTRLLNEMRFKKAAISMVLIYKTVGKYLKTARDTINYKKNEADRERKARDEAFLAALRAAEEAKRIAQQKADMEKALAKQAEENRRQLEEKNLEMEKGEQKLKEIMEKMRLAEDKTAEMTAKQLKLIEETKMKGGAIQGQLMEAQSERDRSLEKVRSLESDIAGKNDELASREKQISDKNAQIDSLKRDITTVKEEIDQLQETGEIAIENKLREIKEQKDVWDIEKEKISAELTLKQNEANKLKQEAAECDRKLKDLKEEAENKGKRYGEKAADYERQLADHNKQIADLKEQINDLRKRLEDAKVAAEAAARVAADELKKARQEGRDEQTKLERVISDKESQIAKLQNDLAILKAQTEQAAKAAADALNAERDESLQAAERQESVILEKDSQLNSTKRELALISGKLEAAVAAQTETATRAKAQETEAAEQMADTMEKGDRNVRKLEGKLSEILSELALYKDRFDNAQKELKLATQSNEDNKGTFDRQVKEKDGLLSEAKAELRKVQAKTDQSIQSTADKTALLEEQLHARRIQERDTQAQYDKQIVEKNRELGEVKSEVELLKSRYGAEKLQSDIDKKQVQEQLAQQRAESDSRLGKFEIEIKQRQSEITDLKEQHKSGKKEWREKQDKFEKKVTELEREKESKQDQINANASKIALLEKTTKSAADEALATASRKETKLLQQVDELKAVIKELHSQVTVIEGDRSKAIGDLEAERQSAADRERKHTEDIAKRKTDGERLDKEFNLFKTEVTSSNESKLQALSGQVQTLKSMVEDEKKDKVEAQRREADYQTRLKDASSRLGEALSELKHIQTTHGAEIEKYRSNLEAAREKHVLESQSWKDKADAYEKQLIEKTTLIHELKADLSELDEREATATQALREKSFGVKEEIRRLKTLNEELEVEQKHWLERQSTYEADIARIGVELVQAQASYAEAERKREGALQELKTDLEVLHAQLEAEKAAARERDADYDKELKLHQQRLNKELQRVRSKQEKDLKLKDGQIKTQDEAFRYKLQFLELSLATLKQKKKAAQDQERLNKKQIAQLQVELRNLRSKKAAASASSGSS